MIELLGIGAVSAMMAHNDRAKRKQKLRRRFAAIRQSITELEQARDAVPIRSAKTKHIATLDIPAFLNTPLNLSAEFARNEADHGHHLGFQLWSGYLASHFPQALARLEQALHEFQVYGPLEMQITPDEQKEFQLLLRDELLVLSMEIWRYNTVGENFALLIDHGCTKISIIPNN